MKRIGFFLVLLAGCQAQVNEVGTEQVTEAYIWGNSLASDGCEESIQPVAGSQTSYKPTTRTLPILQAALRSIPADSKTGAQIARVRYILTGQTVKLSCGWGATPAVSEIEIRSISPR